jgi:DNA-binding response OmpR family regulator
LQTALRIAPSSCRFCGLTFGLRPSETFSKCFEAGADNHLDKPVIGLDLSTCIRRLLRGYSVRRCQRLLVFDSGETMMMNLGQGA